MNLQLSVSLINDGRFATMRTIEVTESPSIQILPQYQTVSQAQETNHQTLMSLLSQVTREMMRMHETNSSPVECSIEYAYVTTPASNQRYLANVRMFLIIRVISAEKQELISFINQFCKRFESSLMAMDYSYTYISQESFDGILQRIDSRFATAVLKDDRIHKLQSPTLPQSFSFDRLGALDSTRKNLYYNLTQFPDCLVSIQLIPSSYNLTERDLISGNSQLLGNLLKGVSDQGSTVSISYTTARRDSETYGYYSDYLEDGIFLYNILVMGSNEGVINLSRSLIQEYSGTLDYRTVLKLVPLNLQKLDLSNNQTTVPWLLIEEIGNQNDTYASTQPLIDYTFYSRLPFLISSDEAASLFHLPIGDHHIGAGLIINESRRANRSYAKGIIDSGDLSIGTIKASSRNSTVGINLSDLTKHMLVAGTPGSGKTTFLIGLLDRLWKDHHIPFLVIEPAKNEYRALLNTIPDLQVFTPGKSDLSPFVFNPFLPPANVRLETFKPSLLTAFSAAVSMSSPLDKIFEESINNCYGDHRWFDHYTVAETGEIFNISDFIQSFEKLFESIGYTGEARNIGRAGVVRLKSIANLFDFYFSIPIEHLIERPTVLELNGIESSEQKSLIISLLLLSILSYINSNRLGDGKLKNIILLEEAHVLMDAKSGNRDGEADPTAVAQGLVRRMLAEIRSYGTGMILADQSPRKVGADIIALTDIKMAFRLVELEDKQMIANSTSMNEAQVSRLSNFKPGEASLYFGRLDEPEEVKVPDYRKDNAIEISMYDAELKIRTTYWKDNAKLMRPYPECKVINECNYDCDIVTKGISKEIARRIHHSYLSQKCVSIQAVKTVFSSMDVLIAQHLNSETCTPRLNRCTMLHLLRRIRYQCLIKMDVNDQNEKPYQLTNDFCLLKLKKEALKK